jgi:hypothetical protein
MAALFVLTRLPSVAPVAEAVVVDLEVAEVVEGKSSSLFLQMSERNPR